MNSQITINDNDLRNNRHTYSMDVLIYNFDNLNKQLIFFTQTLTADFCIRYMLNEIIDDDGDYYDIVDLAWILKFQPKISENELLDVYNKLNQ
jgi:hypothetical protein